MYTGTAIDCDIHHDWPSPAALLPYFSLGWQEYVRAPGRHAAYAASGAMPITGPPLFPSPVSQIRAEALPPGGGPGGSSYELMKDQLLDRCNIERGILGFGSGSFVGAIPNPYFAVEIARAANDWTIDHWLSKDKRLYGSVLVPTQVPEEAAKEIRRIGPHPRMAQVLLVSTGLGRPFGHPVFHPIYEAAVEVGLPIAIHAAGEAIGGTNTSPIASGVPSFYLESHVLNIQGIMSHLVSFIAHGVFEKYRDLKLLLIEGGVTWIPAVLWRFDADYKGVRREVPWLRRYPSEYFHDHVRVTTQPLDVPRKQQHLIHLLDALGAEDVLCFASDYPHWDADEVQYVASVLPKAWHKKVFRDNALKLFGWKDRAAKDRAVQDGAPKKHAREKQAGGSRAR